MTVTAMHPLLRYLRTLVAGSQAEGQSDRQLLEQFIARRDESAFAALVERHGRMVLAVCRRVLRDEHLAEDAFQATFLILARKAATIRRRHQLAGWLHGVALRLAQRARADAARARRPDARR